jgi:HicB family
VAAHEGPTEITIKSNSGRSNFALRIPASLQAEAEKFAVQEGTTLNQFINGAVAETIAALKTVEYLRARKGQLHRGAGDP